MAMVGVASASLLLVLIGLSGFLTCLAQRRSLLEMGPEFHDGAMDFSASLRPDKPRRRKQSRRAGAKARRIVREEELEQAKIDAILAKVSAHGMMSLSWLEKRTLRRATERQRQREVEVSRGRG